MKRVTESILGRKINGTRVVPLVTKIVLLFSLFLLASNFVTNYIGLTLNRGQQIKLMNQLLVKDLKDLYVFCSNQYEIYTYSKDMQAALKSMADKGLASLKGQKSLALGVKPDGSLLFQASRTLKLSTFDDREALRRMVESQGTGGAGDNSPAEGSLTFFHDGAKFFGVYKYNPKWQAYLVRAEELNEFYADSWRTFTRISVAILAITLVCVLVGTFLVSFILRYVRQITRAIMKMQESKELELIDLSDAPNDEVSYLGVAFNALSSEIRNLLEIFRKFATRDVVSKAYRERHIRLEGRQEELAILFSDIKSFTFITEQLGTDIIKLLNIHYENAIARIHEEEGIIGSIIGDALLAVFGTSGDKEHKSLHALRAAYAVQEVTSELRRQMHERREEIIRQRGGLTEAEERVYRAVLLEVGVGIDGGPVFYGNIGSTRRMTNTVIGDNVNAASRLEGLTRIYRVPVICSEYVKNEVADQTDEFIFLEIDQVQVKGKTIAKKIYWPMPVANMDDQMRKDVEAFGRALQLYYRGQWARAHKLFAQNALPLAEEFRGRTGQSKRPRNWNGIWTMTTK